MALLTGSFAVVWNNTHVRHPFLKLANPVGDCSTCHPIPVNTTTNSRLRHNHQTRVNPVLPGTEVAQKRSDLNPDCQLRSDLMLNSRFAQPHVIRENTRFALEVLVNEPLEALHL